MGTQQETKLHKYLDNIANHPVLSLIGATAFILALVLTWIVGFTDNINRLWSLIYGSQTGIVYEVISVSRFTLQELDGYAKSEGLDSFNLNLDDPILVNYYISKIRFRNRGEAIKSGMKIHVSFGKEFVKILDIKHKVILPVNKEITISHPILDLKLHFRERVNYGNFMLSWIPPETFTDGTAMTAKDIAGYNLYRSTFKEVGYGKINENLIKKPILSLGSQERDFFPAFYAVQAVLHNGQPSILTYSPPFPDTYAFNPESYDVIIVDSELKSTKKVTKTGTIIYKSLKNAIEKEGKKVIYFVNENRSKNDKLNNLVIEGVAILYLDDFKFLKGSANISFTSGLDQNAEIIFYVLYKNLPDSGHNIDLTLEGHPEIEFYKSSANTKFNFQIGKDNVVGEMSKKYLLTPSVVTTCLGKHTIYLLWSPPKENAFKGVKIYRKLRNANSKQVDAEDEIYEGPGITKKIKCINRSAVGSVRNNSEIRARSPETHEKINVPNDPPLRKSKTYILPGAPKLAVFEVDDSGVYSIDGNPMPFYADSQVSSHLNYMYILYAYDDEKHYSYPIIINASFNDLSSGLSCDAVDE